MSSVADEHPERILQRHKRNLYFGPAAVAAGVAVLSSTICVCGRPETQTSTEALVKAGLLLPAEGSGRLPSSDGALGLDVAW